jgi:hypothetical protein
MHQQQQKMNEFGGRITGAPPKVRTRLFHESPNDGKTRMDSKETGSSCLCPKAAKRSWRSRSSDNKDEARKPTKPGQCVSVDQLASPTPGLVAQMIGFLTMTRCKHATIYVDQASRLSCIYPQKTATAKDTLLGKEAFELQARERGATIQTCHAHNFSKGTNG